MPKDRLELVFLVCLLAGLLTRGGNLSATGETPIRYRKRSRA